MYNKMKQAIKRSISLIGSFCPEQLPSTEPGLNKLADGVLELLGLPSDNSSLRVAVFQMVLHLTPGKLWITRQGFVKQIKRSIANQTAYNLADDLKQLEKQRKLANEQLQDPASQMVSET